MTKSSCWRHPAKSGVGVCASCLRERLSELAMAEERYVGSPQEDEQAGALRGADDAAEDENAAAVTISTLMDADHAEAEFRKSSAMAALQRTRSWSHSHSSGYGADLGGKLAPFYGEHQLPGPLDTSDTPKHIKASSWPEIDSRKQQQHQQQQQQRKSSWFLSLFGFRKKESSKQPKKATSGGLFGMGRKKKSPERSNPFEDILNSPWQSGNLDEDSNNVEFDLRRHKASRVELQNGSCGKRVTPVLISGDLSGSSTSKLSKMSSVNGRYYGGASRARRDGWSKAISTPLRVFMHKNSNNNRCSSSKYPRRQNRDEVELEGDGFTGTSPKRYHPSPAFSTSYTTYYRDYGSSWSLHSSPMPGKSRQHRASRPWENREAPLYAAHSSPFHASNTWNFYLTPLRPVRSSASRHRP